jgi:ATP-dependent Clp protease ATP-binding subunit ClpA
VFASLDIQLADLRTELIASMGPPTSEPLEAHIPFTTLAKRALELATKEALSLGHNYIGCEHLLLGLLATEDSMASRVLRRMGLELRTTRRAVVTGLVGVVHTQGDRSMPSPNPEDTLERILRRLDAIEHRLAS